MKSKKSPSFQFYAQDFLTGVIYLTNEEIGIYIKMLAKQWTDGSIPKKRLGFLIGKEWENLSEELRSKFRDDGECLINTRLEKEREKKRNFLKKQSENGKKGGRPTKNTEEEKTQNNPSLLKNKTQKKPLEDEDEKEEEIEKEKENEKKGGAGGKTTIWPDFEDFWEEYDKKVGKKAKIQAKWEQLSQKTREEVMAYLPRYKISQPDKKYRKNPETFFNNESWKDEIIESNGKPKQTDRSGPDNEYRANLAKRLGVVQP